LVDTLIAQQGQDGLGPGFAIEGADFDSLDPPSFIIFFHLSIGQALGPAEDGPRCPALGTGRVTTSKGCHLGSLIPRVGISENRWQMPGTQAALRIVDEGVGLLLGALTYHQTHD